MDFGTDLAFVNGDLGLNAQGDIASVTDLDNLTQALQRRFETPLGALFYDTTYGNALLLNLSQPMGPTFEKDAAADVSAAMLADPLVASVNVTVVADRENRTATITLSYVAQDGSTGSFGKVVTLFV